MATCDAAGFKYAGLEYGYECHCSNNEPSGSVIAESNCNVPCEFLQPVPIFTPYAATDVDLQHATGIANSGKMCGAGGIMNIYTKGTTSQGAWSSCCLVQSPIPRPSSAPPPQPLPFSTPAPPSNSSYSQSFLLRHLRSRIEGLVWAGVAVTMEGPASCWVSDETRTEAAAVADEKGYGEEAKDDPFATKIKNGQKLTS